MKKLLLEISKGRILEEALEIYSAVVRDYQSNQNPEYNIPINEVISRIDIVKTFI